MTRTAEQFQLATPRRDGELLVVPEPGRASADLLTNVDLYAGRQISVFGRELTSLRNEIRLELQHELHMPDYLRIIAVGHQPTFHHCGILAKYYLADKLARENNAVVCNFVIDTDVVDPKLALPGKGEGGFVIHSLPLIVDRGELSAEYQISPSGWELKRFREMFNSEVVIPSCQNAAEKLVELIEKTARSTRTVAELVSRINLEYARNMGLNRYDIAVSRLSDTQCFIWFVFNLLRNSQRIWQNYNDAIVDFMREQGVDRSPVPPLGQSDGYLEMPFWLNMPGTKRLPLYFRPADGMIACGETNKVIGLQLPRTPEELHEQLQETGLRIRPRAVLFTTYCRVFFADYFIHGTGGAYYDKVTDIFIRKAFGITPPAYGCASATVQADFGFVPDLDNAELQINELRHKLHDFQSNPQKYVSFRDNTTEVEELLRQKMLLIEKSTAFSKENIGHHDRQVVFEEIRQINQAVCDKMGDIREKIEQQLVQAQKTLVSTKAALCRDLFFGLFDPARIKTVFADLLK